MKIKIDLSRQGVDCLRKHLPPRSSALAVLEKAAHLENQSGVSMAEEWFTFTFQQARELLATAEGSCSDAVFTIKEGMRRAASGSLRPVCPVLTGNRMEANYIDRAFH